MQSESNNKERKFLTFKDLTDTFEHMANTADTTDKNKKAIFMSKLDVWFKNQESDSSGHECSDDAKNEIILLACIEALKKFGEYSEFIVLNLLKRASNQIDITNLVELMPLSYRIMLFGAPQEEGSLLGVCVILNLPGIIKALLSNPDSCPVFFKDCFVASVSAAGYPYPRKQTFKDIISVYKIKFKDEPKNMESLSNISDMLATVEKLALLAKTTYGNHLPSNDSNLTLFSQPLEILTQNKDKEFIFNLISSFFFATVEKKYLKNFFSIYYRPSKLSWLKIQTA